MTDDWKIHKDRRSCEKPGCPLPTSRSYFAVLEWLTAERAAGEGGGEGGGEGAGGSASTCVRRELCDACFRDHERVCPPDQPPIFWRAFRKRAGQKEPTLDLQSLRVLFDRLGNVDDDRARALRYFCALLLLRKRVLKMARPRTAAEERADLVVVDPKLKEQEPVALFAPAIDPSDLGAVKDELLAAISATAEE